MQISLKSGQVWVRWATLLAVLVTAACIDATVIGNDLAASESHCADWGGIGNRWRMRDAGVADLAALNRRIEAPAVAIAKRARDDNRVPRLSETAGDEYRRSGVQWMWFAHRHPTRRAAMRDLRLSLVRIEIRSVPGVWNRDDGAGNVASALGRSPACTRGLRWEFTCPWDNMLRVR